MSALIKDGIIHEHYPEETFPIDELDSNIRYKIINIVMTADLSTNVNLNNIAMSMPLLDITGFEKKKNKKTDIPYYGKENAIVSANYDKYRRGIRKIDKPLKKILYVDYQFFGKNQHVKISTGNIHITGIRSEETGHDCIQKLIDKIKYMNDIIRSINIFEDKDMLYNIAKDDNIPLHYIEEMKDYDPEFYNMYSFLTINKVNRGDSYDDFLKSVIYENPAPFYDPLSITRFNIHNKVFYVNTCNNICLRKLNSKAIEAGHRVTFFNWHIVQSTKITIMDRKENSCKKIIFKIHNSGGVNFWCDSSSKRSFEAFKLLLPILEQCYLGPSLQKRQYERRTPRNKI